MEVSFSSITMCPHIAILEVPDVRLSFQRRPLRWAAIARGEDDSQGRWN